MKRATNPPDPERRANRQNEGLAKQIIACYPLPSHSNGGFIMAHFFEIKNNKKGEFVAYFKYNKEAIFWTEGYKTKASAKKAIESILKNGPAAEVRETLG
jgi:uncharacterized protein